MSRIYAYAHEGRAYLFRPPTDGIWPAPSAGLRLTSPPLGDQLLGTEPPPPYVYYAVRGTDWRLSRVYGLSLARIDNPPAGIETGWRQNPADNSWGPPDLRPEIRAAAAAERHYDEANLISQLRLASCTTAALESAGKAVKELAGTLTAGSAPRVKAEEAAAEIAKEVSVLQAERGEVYARALPVRILMAHVEGLGKGQSARHTAAAALAEADRVHAKIAYSDALTEDHHDAVLTHLRGGAQATEEITDAVATRIAVQAQGSKLPHQVPPPAETPPPPETPPETPAEGGGASE